MLMQTRRFSKYLPTAQSVRNSRLLKPFDRLLHHHFLWQLNRRAVAGGVAVGLFFGIIVPFGQVFLAALAAVVLRVNLPVAVLFTLVTNPFTFLMIYYFAYRLGDRLTGGGSDVPVAVIDAEIEQTVIAQQAEAAGWASHLIDWLQSVGMPLAVGLVVIAVTTALIGYFTVSNLWKLWVRWQWRRRRLTRSEINATR